MKKLIIDLDGTLTIDDPEVPYSEKLPNTSVVARLREYHQLGFTIVVSTARNMRAYNGSIGAINVNTLPTIIEWLQRHAIPFDEILVGKPWCGTEGFYVDDKAVRPSEFVELSYAQISRLLSVADYESIKMTRLESE